MSLQDYEEEEEVAILDDCKLTDEQRREVRKQQRALTKDLEGGETLEVETARERNNEIYKNVRYTREAVLDGENLALIANKAAQKVERFIQVPRYDADRLVSKLGQKCRSSGGATSFFDWKALGMEAGVCFNAIPSNVSFLNGPLMDGAPLQVRQRATRRRNEEEEEEEAKEEKPEDVQGHTTRDADQLSAIEKSMVVIQKTLKKKVDEQYNNEKKRLNEAYNSNIPEPVKKKLKKHGAEICAVQFLFNPQSFTQTVENLFHYSFLVKKGSASIAVRQKTLAESGMAGKPGPVVKYTNESKKHGASRQAVLSFTPKDWRDLCEAYEVTKGDLPHRTGSKQTRKSASLSQLPLSQQSA